MLSLSKKVLIAAGLAMAIGCAKADAFTCPATFYCAKDGDINSCHASGENPYFNNLVPRGNIRNLIYRFELAFGTFERGGEPNICMYSNEETGVKRMLEARVPQGNPLNVQISLKGSTWQVQGDTGSCQGDYRGCTFGIPNGK